MRFLGPVPETSQSPWPLGVRGTETSRLHLHPRAQRRRRRSISKGLETITKLAGQLWQRTRPRGSDPRTEAGGARAHRLPDTAPD